MCKSLGSIPNTTKKMNKKQTISLKSSKSSPFLRGKSPVYQVGMVRACMVWSFLAKLTSHYHLYSLSQLSRNPSVPWRQSLLSPLGCHSGSSHYQEYPIRVYPSLLPLSHLKFAALSSGRSPGLGMMWPVLLALFTLEYSHLLLQLPVLLWFYPSDPVELVCLLAACSM